MCELFGLSSSRPVSPRELLCRFGERGGDVADNLDGWGLATLQDGVFSTAKEPHAAAQSAHFQGLCGQTFSALIVGHVRKANPPTARVLANTHPFRRTCCGRDWVFAHNGVIPDAVTITPPSAAKLCEPSADTDSEQAFWTLNYLPYGTERSSNGLLRRAHAFAANSSAGLGADKVLVL